MTYSDGLLKLSPFLVVS